MKNKILILLILTILLSALAPAVGAKDVKGCPHLESALSGESKMGDGDRFSAEILVNVSEGMQGTAIYGDYAFLATSLGKCNVYSISKNKKLGSFWLASGTPGLSGGDKNANHCNQMMFGSERFSDDDQFPLLFISTGNTGEHSADGSYIAKCAVERIRYDERKQLWSSELVMTIAFNDSENIPDADKDGPLTECFDREKKKFFYSSGNGYSGEERYEKACWGWPAFFTDSEPTDATKGKLFIFSARFRTTTAYEARHKLEHGIKSYSEHNAYIITEFDMPSLPSSPSSPSYGKTVTVFPRDIKDQFTTEFDIYFTQGGTMRQGRIYYSFGMNAGQGKPHSNGIRVFDIESKSIAARIDLSEDRKVTGVKEPECCAFYNGKLAMSAVGSSDSPGSVIYVFPFAELHGSTEASCTSGGVDYTFCLYCNERLSELGRTEKLAHRLIQKQKKDPTYSEVGIKEHYECSACGSVFTDADGNVSANADDLVIPALTTAAPASESGCGSAIRPAFIALAPTVTAVAFRCFRRRSRCR